MRVCDVYIEETFLQNQTLTYLCQDFDVAFGNRVWVNVRGRRMMAFVKSVYEASLDAFEFELQPILSVVDDTAIINQELFEIAEFMSYQTVTPLIRCLQTVLPNKLRPQTNATKPKMTRGIQYIGGADEDTLTKKQREFVERYKEYEFVTLKEARAFYSGYRSLIDKGIFKEVEKEASYQEADIEEAYPRHSLTQVQRKVFESVSFDSAHTYLLHGVTGSGKTELYLQWAEYVLKQNKSVLFLVPEISLTPQMIERVSKRFGKDVGIYHSSLNDQEKYEQYLRVKKGETQIVVGTRSAIFMPFSNLGLIVMDEEHDHSYKQSNMPMYATHDIAHLRSEYHHCPLILGSASPRLESYARALRGNYTLLELPQRINETFPKVNVVDTKEALYQQESGLMTHDLLTAIESRLKRREQVILVLNRRGYMTLLKDAVTQEVLMCPNCDISLNYHKHDNTLKCHQCDYQTKEIPRGSDNQPLKVVGSGVGTQRLQEYLEHRFPNAKVGRMDRDTTTRKNAHEKILTAFRNHEYDILVGTQMIAKGLDIPNVTLVGILNIDTALGHEDFRSVEDTFNLILQASGRSGRGEKQGEVIVQTFNVNHYAIQYAVHNQYKSFFKQEMQYRKLAQYPPYSYLISIVFSDENESNTYRKSQEFLKYFNDENIKVLGPSFILRLRGFHRVRIILKGKNLDEMLRQVHSAYDKIDKGGIRIDVNPMTLM